MLRSLRGGQERADAREKRLREAAVWEDAHREAKAKWEEETAKRKAKEQEKLKAMQEKLAQRSTGKEVTAQLIVDEGWLVPVKADEDDDFWWSKCNHCVTNGKGHQCKWGEDVLLCGFCRKVGVTKLASLLLTCVLQAYHDRPECVGKNFYPIQNFESSISENPKDEKPWMCPCCFTFAKEQYEGTPAHTYQIKRALSPSTTVRPASEFLFTIVSKGRAANVKAMHTLFDGTSTVPCWIVGEGEKGAYEKAGVGDSHFAASAHFPHFYLSI